MEHKVKSYTRRTKRFQGYSTADVSYSVKNGKKTYFVDGEETSKRKYEKAKKSGWVGGKKKENRLMKKLNRKFSEC